MLVTYGTAIRRGFDPATVAAMAGGALIAPFFLFSALAGELADRFERSRLLQVLKAAELLTVLVAAAALLAGSLGLCFLALFALGAQATLSSPVRYALLPQHLAPDELVDGNALARRRHLPGDPVRHDRRRHRGGARLGHRTGDAAARRLRDRRASSRAFMCRARRRRRRGCASAAIRSPPRSGSCVMPSSAATSSCRSSAPRGSGWSAACSCRRSRSSPRTRSAPAAAS